LYGGSTFQEIYHESQSFVLPLHPALVQQQGPPPSEVQLGIAYGIHLARIEQQQQQQKSSSSSSSGTTTAPDKRKASASATASGSCTDSNPLSALSSSSSMSPLELIQNGAESLSAMNEGERQLFWNYMMMQCQR
jgi:hypothetical protein